MRINIPDWLRELRMAASVGRPAVKFAADGSFGVHTHQGFAVFGKSVNLNHEIAFADIEDVIKNLKCISNIQVNVEITNGTLSIGDGDNIYYCLLAPSELVENYKHEDLQNVYSNDWLDVTVQIEKLYDLAKTIKATKSNVVWFFADNGRLVAIDGTPGNLWKVNLGIGFMPRPFLITAQKLLQVLNVLDVSRVFISFKFSSPSILRIKLSDSLGGNVVWYLTERLDRSGWQTYQQQRLLLPHQG